MRCVILMFDSLIRERLAPYGATDTHTPNFDRLAGRCKTFDRSYVASMPCMPARRDLHTGRPGFLHRGWGPLEPWDKSVFEELRAQAGTYSHLSTDHYHYFEDGGTNYHCRYDTWDFARGQEGDPWVGVVGDAGLEQHPMSKVRRQDPINRRHVEETGGEAAHWQTVTLDNGLGFLERNAAEDNWLLQIECFDPHEPFFASERFRALFPSPDGEEEGGGPPYDWPRYEPAPDDPALVEEARRHYRQLLAQCDDSLGRVLDAFDERGMWQDTALVVWTDHGILLGEHGWMLKNEPPLYEEISHTPLFVHDPAAPGPGRRSALCQPAVDLTATLYDLFDATPPQTVTGRSLRPVVAGDEDTPLHEAVLFGYHGRAVNLVTDAGLCCYRGDNGSFGSPFTSETHTLRPAQMRGEVHLDPLREARLGEPLPDSQGVRPMVIGRAQIPDEPPPTLVFDLNADPRQERPIGDAARTDALLATMARMMRDLSAPPSQFQRLHLK